MKKFICLAMLFCVLATFAQNTKYVNLFMGSSGDNGQLAPGATVPFGVVCVCPDSDPRTHAGYNYEVTKVTGISINRLSGVGCSGGGGNMRIRPVHPSEELHIFRNMPQECVITSYGIIICYCYYDAFFHNYTATTPAICGCGSYSTSSKSSYLKSKMLFTSGLIFILGSLRGSRVSCSSTCSKWFV